MSEPGYGGLNHYQGESGEAYHAQAFQFDEAGVYFVSSKFAHLVAPKDVVLDFGAGAGHGLAGLRCERKIAVELNPKSREVLSERGFEVYGSLEDAPDYVADLAITNHCLEHVPYPLEALRQLRHKIKPGGRLAVCVPIDDWRTSRTFDAGDHNMHLHTWTIQLLGNTLKEAGYRVGPRAIEVVSRTRPGRFTNTAYKRLPKVGFRMLCKAWSIATRRRELFAVVEPVD